MLEIFQRGGPIMWPLLVTSFVTMTVVLERIAFFARHSRGRRPDEAERILDAVERGDVAEIESLMPHPRDLVARVLIHGLRHRSALSTSLLRQASTELVSLERGLTVLDTAITLSPLLGLLGTVTGMIRSFSLLGGQELGAPAAITGGIAEALIATAFGLGIAIFALVPFNVLQSRVEKARREIEDAASRLEVLLARDRQ